MSRQKPWPTVANRHRIEAIMESGEIKNHAAAIIEAIKQLEAAAKKGNLAMVLVICREILATARLIQKTAVSINTTLENAPSSEEE